MSPVLRGTVDDRRGQVPAQRSAASAWSDDDLRIVVVDDHATLAELLTLALQAEPGLRCVGSAASAAEAHDLVRRARPDVVVMDVELGGDDGLVLTAALTRELPDLRVVVLTAKVDSRVMQRAVDAGACALLPKSGPLMQTLRSVREARRGGLDVDPAVLRQLLRRQQQEATATARVDLTARESEVLRLLATGLDVRRIAQALTISEHTCRGHVKSLLRKLDSHTQLEAVAVANRLGLVMVTD